MKAFLILLLISTSLLADEAPSEKGFHYLTNKAFSSAFGPFNISAKEFDNLYKTWPEELQKQVDDNPEQRRALTFKYYGFTPREFPVTNEDLPYGFTERKKKGKYELSCLTCHSGTVKYVERTGTTKTAIIPGRPNTELDLQSFFEDRMKLRKKNRRWGARGFKGFAFRQYMKRFLSEDKITYARGTTVPWKSVAYTLWMRTKRMNLKISSFLKALISMKWIDDLRTTPVSLDVPAWWTTAKKTHLYADAFAPFSGKTILVSALTFGSPTKRLLKDFNNIEAYVRSVQVPANPFKNRVDIEKVAQGKEVFNLHCAGCHGKYENGVLEEGFHAKTIDIHSVKTDSSRLYEGVTREFRRRVSDSWVGEYFKKPIRIDPVGYQAPPLLGLWASAPYFHNGSVPTVYHVLFPEERPTIWRAKEGLLNVNTLGLDFETVDEVPMVLTEKEQRHFYDTTQYSLSNEGHDYPNKLTRDERMLVLEYLKTL